jgi:hypothetical protein
MLMIGSNEIGGGYVRLGFKDSSRHYKMGEPLTAEKIKSFHNYRRLIDVGMIAVYPPPPKGTLSGINVLPVAVSDRHIVSAGFGRFDVYEGRKLNDKALTKDEAEKLAHDANQA